jgi:peptidyl-prolyl cis-trans isomerase SurA
MTQLDELYSFTYVIEVYNEKTPRTYEQAVGLVLNDCQQELEEKWINKLKKKYPVKVNERVLRGLREGYKTKYLILPY